MLRNTSGTAAHQFSAFGERVAVLVVQRDHRALPDRELRIRAVDVDIAAGVRQMLVRGLAQLVRGIVDEDPSQQPPTSVKTEVHADPGEPRSGLRLVVEIPPPSPSEEPCFLDGVLRVCRVSKYRERNRKEAALLRLEGSLEGLRICGIRLERPSGSEIHEVQTLGLPAAILTYSIIVTGRDVRERSPHDSAW